MASVEESQRPVGDGEVAVRWLRPVETPRALLVYLLGFSVGARPAALDDFDVIGRKLAERTLATVGAVEHPGPGVDVDAVAAAVNELVRSERDRYAKDLPVVLVGEAWGAGVALRTCLRLAEGSGGGAPDALFLVTPMLSTDPSQLGDPAIDGLGLLTTSELLTFVDGAVDALEGVDDDQLVQLPPTQVLLAELDPLLRQGRAVTHRLREAGVEVTEVVYPRQAHGFFGRLMLFASERVFQLVVKTTRAHVARRKLAHTSEPAAAATAAQLSGGTR